MNSIKTYYADDLKSTLAEIQEADVENYSDNEHEENAVDCLMWKTDVKWSVWIKSIIVWLGVKNVWSSSQIRGKNKSNLMVSIDLIG